MKIKKISKDQWFDILASPFTLALPIAVFVILLLPDIFQKYVVKQTFSGRSDNPNSIVEYHDLDGDGYSERVTAYPNTIGGSAVKVYHNDGILIDQWNFSGKYPTSGTRFFCADLNADSLKEIYVFTYRNDTLYLNAFDPMNDGRIIFKNKFITTFGFYEGKADIRLGFPMAIDLDGDGLYELLIRVHGGFSKQPRGLFAYNAVRDTFIRTPVLAANISNVLCADMDEDGKPEIFCSCNTVGNIPDSMDIPYSDYSSWFMGFDEKLQFLFPPVEYAVYPSSCNIVEIKSGEKKRIAAIFKNRSQSPRRSMIVLFNEKGEIIRRKFPEDYNLSNFSSAYLFTMDHK